MLGRVISFCYYYRHNDPKVELSLYLEKSFIIENLLCISSVILKFQKLFKKSERFQLPGEIGEIRINFNTKKKKQG